MILQGCDTFVFYAILEFTLAQFLMRRSQSNTDVKKAIDKTAIISFKNNQVKPTDSTDKTDQKSNIFVKILGLETYFGPVQGQFGSYYGGLKFYFRGPLG